MKNIDAYLPFLLLLFLSIDKVFPLQYYRVQYIEDDSAWIDLRGENFTSFNVKSEILSNQYISFAKRELKFDFPFYGEKISSVSVTTQGFISMIEDRYLTPYETQYISPLMANYQPEDVDPQQDVRTHADDKMFIVQWSTMVLGDDGVGREFFTFQTQLLNDGTIKFVYKEVPIRVEDIPSDIHQVRVGVSGAYRTNRTSAKEHSFTYHEFDTISLMDQQENPVASHTTFVFYPQPSCVEQSRCGKCHEVSEECFWCPGINRCSTGEDSLQPLWHHYGCFSASQLCEEYPSTNPSSSNNNTPTARPEEGGDERKRTSIHDVVIVKALLIATSAVVFLLVVAGLLVRSFGWRLRLSYVKHVKLEDKNERGCCEGGTRTLIHSPESST